MKKQFVFALVALLCCWAVDAVASTLTETEALQLVKNNRTAEGLNNTNVNFYVAMVDTIVNNYRCPVDMSTVTEQWLTDETPKWLVFVDEEPLKVWLHGCKYYYVGSDNQLMCFSGILPPEGLQSFFVERNLTVDNSNLPRPVFPSRPRLAPSVGNVNLLADSTYVVLVSRGETYDEDMLFLRDIRLIYQMLTQVYDINKSHIKVITRFQVGEYVNPGSMFDLRMYYDVDGDGENEYIEEGANYVDAVKEYADRTAYPNSRHVFLFREALSGGVVTGGTSGVRNWMTSQSGTRILNVFTVAGREITEDDANEDNKVLTRLYTDFPRTSENPYNQNVVAWVNALSQCDVFTGVHIASDTDNNGYISMAEAANYSNLSCGGNMTCRSLSQGLQDVVSFDRCPISPKLTVRDNAQDTGVAPNTYGATWNSPDIWYRNQDDGEESQISEVIDDASNQYVYVRVNNNSDVEYEGYGQKLYIALTGMETPVYHDYEMESFEFSIIDSIPIYQHIPAHGSAVVTCPVNLASNGFGMDYNKIIASVGYCLPNYFQDDMYTDVPPMPTPKEDECLAMSTLVTIDPSTGSNQWQLGGNSPISMARQAYGYDYQLAVGAAETIEVHSPFSNANDRGAFTIGLQLPGGINASYSGFRKESASNIYVLNSSNAQISASSLAGSEIYLKVYTNGLIATSDKKYCFDLVLKDANGDITGGVSVLLAVEGSNGGGGIIIMMDEGAGSVELSAANLPSHSSVNWYGENMESVGEGEVLTIASEDLQDMYTMVATEEESGNIAVDSIDLSAYNSISNATVSGSDVIVRIARPAAPRTSLSLVTYNASGVNRQMVVNSKATEVVIPAGDLASGIYILSLAVNGKTVSTYSFVKQ